MTDATSTDERFMRLALQEAERALDHGDVPVGAVLAHGGEVIGAGHNERELRQDPSAHAEMIALRAGAAALGSWRLLDTVLYVTLEPCAMCAAAIAAARVSRLLYGAADPKSGGVEHGARVFAHRQAHHKPEIYGGIAERESSALMRAFFAERR